MNRRPYASREQFELSKHPNNYHRAISKKGYVHLLVFLLWKKCLIKVICVIILQSMAVCTFAMGHISTNSFTRYTNCIFRFYIGTFHLCCKNDKMRRRTLNSRPKIHTAQKFGEIIKNQILKMKKF